jgi:hypothetical protein
MMLCVCITYSQSNGTYISYVSANKDTLILPNDDIGHMISDSWKDTLRSEQPKILFASQSAIAVMNSKRREEYK